jgi:hypothetical protein
LPPCTARKPVLTRVIAVQCGIQSESASLSAREAGQVKPRLLPFQKHATFFPTGDGEHFALIGHLGWIQNSIFCHLAKLRVLDDTFAVFVWSPQGASCVQVPLAGFSVNSLKWNADGSALLLMVCRGPLTARTSKTEYFRPPHLGACCLDILQCVLPSWLPCQTVHFFVF